MIRQANKNDLCSIGEVYCSSWKAAYRGIIADEYLDSLTVESSTPKGVINYECNLVADESGVIAGVANFGVCRDKSDTGELRAIYVRPEYWSKGVGKALFSAACSALKAKGYNGFCLWVLTDNARARLFYEKAGMTCTNIERGISICDHTVYEIKYEMKL